MFSTGMSACPTTYGWVALRTRQRCPCLCGSSSLPLRPQPPVLKKEKGNQLEEMSASDVGLRCHCRALIHWWLDAGMR